MNHFCNSDWFKEPLPTSSLLNLPHYYRNTAYTLLQSVDEIVLYLHLIEKKVSNT